MTYWYRDYRDNVVVDPDAPVLAWRQEKGHRLAFENSHEALAWNVFAAFDRLGVLGAVLGLEAPTYYPWARARDGTPLEPFAAARTALEPHLRGPDVNFAEPEALIVDAPSRSVVAIVAGLTGTLSGKPPRWFEPPAKGTAGRRRRRAILDDLCREEGSRGLFRRGLEEAVRRGYWVLARKLLLTRAAARRMGAEARLVAVIHPAAMRRAAEDAARFEALLEGVSADTFRVTTWNALWGAVPPDAKASDEGRAIDRYLRTRTINRCPAGLLGVQAAQRSAPSPRP